MGWRDMERKGRKGSGIFLFFPNRFEFNLSSDLMLFHQLLVFPWRYFGISFGR